LHLQTYDFCNQNTHEYFQSKVLDHVFINFTAARKEMTCEMQCVKQNARGSAKEFSPVLVIYVFYSYDEKPRNYV